MSNFVIDGDFTIAAAVSQRRWSAPFGDNVLCVFEQDFEQNADDWEPLPIDTTDADYPEFFLVAENNMQEVGIGVMRWTRVYAKVPPQRNEWETHAFRYPGFVTVSFTIGGITTTMSNGREPFNQTVISRLQYDFFHPGHDKNIKLPKDIPVLEGFVAWTSEGRGAPTEYLGNLTTPTAENYALRMRSPLIAPSTQPWSYPFQAAVQTGNELVAEDSSVSRWMGNIYVRTTRFIPTL